jgi:1-acyl-sn-glycerol-3-phosphate acyltransferase
VRGLTGAQACWTSEPVHAQTIYFANHTSHLDFLLLWSALPATLRARTRPVAAADYWKKSALRQYLAARVFRAVLIERERVTREHHPLRPMLDALEAGDSLIIFPEGTRTPDGTMGEFKSGLYHLAQHRPEVTLVPVYIDNLSRVLPKGEVLPVPLLCSLRFGAPLARTAGEGKQEFLVRSRQAVQVLAEV